MLQDLYIKVFKCFRDFQLTDISRVMLVSKKNNVMKDSVSQLGIAAQKGCWPLEHEAFIEIRAFIRELTTFN